MTAPISDTTWLDATAQADLIRRGEVSPKELTEAAIAGMDPVNPRFDAVIRTRFDAARQEADGDLPDGPFRGVPMLFKDIGGTVAGEPTAFGLGPLPDFPWPVSVQLVATYGREDILTRVASQLEQAVPWSERHPPTRT